MSPLIIAVDAGGTSTKVRITRDAAAVAEYRGRSGAVRPGGALAASLIIAEAIRAALTPAGLLVAEADVLVVGAAGTGREEERDALAQALRAERLARRVLVTTDSSIAMADAFDETPGILLIVGTGSIATARDAEGNVHRVGGWGWQIGDEGSGAWLGREAVRAVLRMRDGRSASTALASQIRVAARVASDDALVAWGNSVSAAEFALLAPVLLKAAAEGDPVAMQLRSEALAALAELVRQAAALSGAAHVALHGGLVQDPIFRGLLADVLQPLTVREAPVDPLRGALRLAR